MRTCTKTLRCTDPLGREIALADARWYGKILLDHPILERCLELVEQILTAPDAINDDKSRPDVEVFYREVTLPAPVGRRLLKVCVRFAGTPDDPGYAEGYVLTAYPVLNQSPGEIRRWP